MRFVAPLLAIISLVELACDKIGQPLTAKTTEPAKNGPGVAPRECSDLLSQIAGLDKEITERLSGKYDIQWRLQAFGSIGKELYARMLDQEEMLIKAHAKREQIYSRAGYDGCDLDDVGDDTSDCIELITYSCIQGIRDSTKPDGYRIDTKACGTPEIKSTFSQCMERHIQRGRQVLSDQRARKQRPQ